jgi:hypothetical protein
MEDVLSSSNGDHDSSLGALNATHELVNNFDEKTESNDDETKAQPVKQDGPVSMA